MCSSNLLHCLQHFLRFSYASTTSGASSYESMVPPTPLERLYSPPAHRRRCPAAFSALCAWIFHCTREKRTLTAQHNFASDPGASASLKVWEGLLVRSLGAECPDGIRRALAQTAHSALFLHFLCFLESIREAVRVVLRVSEVLRRSQRDGQRSGCKFWPRRLHLMHRMQALDLFIPLRLLFFFFSSASYTFWFSSVSRTTCQSGRGDLQGI